MDTRRKGPDRRSRRGRRRRSPRALALSPCTAAPGRRREGGGARRDGGGQPRVRGEARRWREERRAGRRLAGGGRVAWRPVARGRGWRARGVEADGSQRQARAVCGSPAFYPLKDVNVEDDKTQGPFFIYSCPLKRYGPKWHNLTSSGSQISILRVRGPKWHLEISSRAAGVFNSKQNHRIHDLI